MNSQALADLEILLNKDSEEIRKKQKEYINYVQEHVNNVRKAWFEVKMKCKTYLVYMCPMSDLKTIDYCINTHDQSKFSKEEFEPYRKNFYPINDQEKEENKEAFDLAWKHHYMVNPHHWDHWYEMDRLDEMPFTFVVEMICDWQAMSYKFGGNAKEWYEKNKNSIVLGKNQRKWVEELLNKLCD